MGWEESNFVNRVTSVSDGAVLSWLFGFRHIKNHSQNYSVRREFAAAIMVPALIAPLPKMLEFTCRTNLRQGDVEEKPQKHYRQASLCPSCPSYRAWQKSLTGEMWKMRGQPGIGRADMSAGTTSEWYPGHAPMKSTVAMNQPAGRSDSSLNWRQGSTKLAWPCWLLCSWSLCSLRQPSASVPHLAYPMSITFVE